jgi:dolichyl-phosphate beta-glucosyltransferase
VVIPAYDEAARLPAHLTDVLAYFDGRGEPYEVIVVDDGSRDRTSEAIEPIAATHAAVRLQRFETNHGKGFAVRAGMRIARGALRLMADADGATPIAEVKRLEAAIQSGADLAVGSRVLRGPAVVPRVRAHRQIVGNVFNRIVRALGVSGVSDSQCGFKLFRGPVAADLFGALRTEGFGFDVELLLLAQRRGYRIADVPVNWIDQPGSRVSVLREGPRMLGQILLARCRVARGAGRTR